LEEAGVAARRLKACSTDAPYNQSAQWYNRIKLCGRVPYSGSSDAWASGRVG